MSEKNGVNAITDTIQAEAQRWADEQTAAAKREADAVLADFQAQADAAYQNALTDAGNKAQATQQRAVSQGDMDQRKMLLAARQECIAGAFDKALEQMCALPDEERALLMIKNAVRYQTGDAEYIFNAKDREKVGPLVVETVNAIFKKQQISEIFSGSLMEQLKKLFAATDKYTATLSDEVGSFAGGFVLRQGDVESNCTFEVLISQVRENLEGETAALLFE